MKKTARRCSRASMAAMILAATALSDPAFAQAQDRAGFNPHKHLAQNVPPAGRPGVAAEAVAITGTAARERLRQLWSAEGSTAALPAALDEFERLRDLTKRGILTIHSAVTGAGAQGDSENVNGERS